MLLLAVSTGTTEAGTVSVRFHEGAAQGFLSLRSMDGEELAVGEMRQLPRGELTETRLVFAFKDGSSHEETVTFSQHQIFRLERYDLLQRGPAFPTPTKLSVDRASGRYRLEIREGNKKERIDEGDLDLPPDTYNGMQPLLLKNIPPGATETVHVVVFTPKPRLVELQLSPAGEDTFSVGHTQRKATHYVGKPRLGAIVGTFAKILGKYPPDYQFWFLAGDIPAFLAFEGPLYIDGPICRVELTSPRWPKATEKK